MVSISLLAWSPAACVCNLALLSLSSAADWRKNGDSLHPRQVCYFRAASEPTQDRGECERLRPAVLGGGAVLPEPGVLGDRAAGSSGRARSAGRSQPAGRPGAEGEERQEGD